MELTVMAPLLLLGGLCTWHLAGAGTAASAVALAPGLVPGSSSAAAAQSSADSLATVAVDCSAGDSLEHALARLRSSQARSQPAVLEVSGECQLAAPLRLGPSDSGAVWRAGSAGATISGGKRIVGWAPSAGSATQLQADV